MAACSLPAPVLMMAALISLEPAGGGAQERVSPVPENAALVVDGVVREIFQSPRRDRVDFLVQIEVKRSEAIRALQTPARMPVPAPGDMVYVHASDADVGPERERGGFLKSQPPPAARSGERLPAERSQVRVFLVPHSGGGWEGTGSPWFKLTTNELVESGAVDSPPVGSSRAPGSSGRPMQGPDSTRTGKSALVALGLTGEAMTVQGRFVVRVSSVEPGGPSQHAGLEPGDIIIGLNDKPLTGMEQLDAIGRPAGRFTLVILDVNTGKTVRVPVDVRASDGPGAPGRLPVPGENPNPPVIADEPPNSFPTPRPPARSLGISAEPVTIGQRTAMKVVGVHPDSPGQKAGLEPGDIIVAANGVPVTGVEALGTAVRKSGSTLSLTVRDTRTGRDTRVDVKLGGDEPGVLTPPPVDSAPTSGPPNKRLGAVTELVFYDVDPAVKVTEVEPGSSAALAGIEPGDVIVEANGSPVLHPKELDEVVRKSPSTLKLVVVNPRTRQKSTVDVKLGAER